MGSSGSRNKNPKTSIPSYAPGSPGINRPIGPAGTGIGGASPLNQQQQLAQANQTIAQLNNQIQALQRGGAPQMPYGGFAPPPPYGNYYPPGPGTPPMPYGGYFPQGGIPPPMPNSGFPPVGYGAGYGPPSPLPQRPGGFFQNQQAAGGYRDTDFTALASISGLEPTEIAFLHREFMNLTRNGASKMDRTIFRGLLRDVLLEASNDHADRAIEKMFIQIDRNHDGYIDFPEFVGAFKDVLKKGEIDPPAYLLDDTVPDLLTEQLRATGLGSNTVSKPMLYMQQPEIAGPLVTTGGLNIVPLASAGVHQQLAVMNPGVQQVAVMNPGVSAMQISDASPPFVTLDPDQSSFVIATPGQYLITQPTALQCVPLPIL